MSVAATTANDFITTGFTVTYTPPDPWITYPVTCQRCNCTPCCCSVTVSSVWPYLTPPSKVRLSPDEWDTLHGAAKKDDDLRAVLQRLRHLIEVEVDFEPSR